MAELKVLTVRIDAVDDARLPENERSERRRGRRLPSPSSGSSVVLEGPDPLGPAGVDLMRKTSFKDDFDRWSFARTADLAFALPLLTPVVAWSPCAASSFVADDGSTASDKPERGSEGGMRGMLSTTVEGTLRVASVEEPAADSRPSTAASSSTPDTEAGSDDRLSTRPSWNKALPNSPKP